jgi:hypothetical protein
MEMLSRQRGVLGFLSEIEPHKGGEPLKSGSRHDTVATYRSETRRVATVSGFIQLLLIGNTSFSVG